MDTLTHPVVGWAVEVEVDGPAAVAIYAHGHVTDCWSAPDPYGGPDGLGLLVLQADEPPDGLSLVLPADAVRAFVADDAPYVIDLLGCRVSLRPPGTGPAPLAGW
jgi:hypothetical protein